MSSQPPPRSRLLPIRRGAVKFGGRWKQETKDIFIRKNLKERLLPIQVMLLRVYVSYPTLFCARLASRPEWAGGILPFSPSPFQTDIYHIVRFFSAQRLFLFLAVFSLLSLSLSPFSAFFQNLCAFPSYLDLLLIYLHTCSQVLTTYWSLDQVEVEDLMTEFTKKSLANSEFDPDLDSTVFTIHDLQLDYLKSVSQGDREAVSEDGRTVNRSQYPAIWGTLGPKVKPWQSGETRGSYPGSQIRIPPLQPLEGRHRAVLGLLISQWVTDRNKGLGHFFWVRRDSTHS